MIGGLTQVYRLGCHIASAEQILRNKTVSSGGKRMRRQGFIRSALFLGILCCASVIMAQKPFYNVALNPQDLPQADWQALTVKSYPHASSNSETRTEPWFFARCVINDTIKNTSHGSGFPSWGPEQRIDNMLQIDFGHEVAVDSVTLYIRADFPHDNYWYTGRLCFSDSSKVTISIDSTKDAQGYKFTERVTRWLRFDSLIWHVPNTWCALSQLQVWGHDTIMGPICKRFKDDFSDGVADGWNLCEGIWNVNDGQYQVGSSAGAKALISDSNFTDFTLDADIKIGSSGNAGLIFRVTNPAMGADAYRGYYVGIGASSITLGKASNSWTEIKSVPATISTSSANHLRVKAYGDSIKIFINGSDAPVIAVEDKSFSGGTIGLRTFNTDASFDNIVVADECVTATVPYISGAQLSANPLSLQARYEGQKVVLSYRLPRTGHVRLSIFDLAGREIAVAIDGWKNAGDHTVMLPKNLTSDGVLLCRLERDGQVATTRVTVVAP
jgi:hypothetical protein